MFFGSCVIGGELLMAAASRTTTMKGDVGGITEDVAKARLKAKENQHGLVQRTQHVTFDELRAP